MLFLDYNLDDHLAARYREGREDGHKEGEAKRDKYFLDLLDQGLSKDEIKMRLSQTKS
ncbi:MAG: hypothetical protein LBU66_05415 [Treponema sp.]|jgi:hypothetical protein|nr:hypothetical protein [Treponema sp.]